MLPTIEQTKAYYQARPKKISAAIVIFFNQAGSILIVKPNYKASWLFPGGGVDQDESPLNAARREITEELGMERQNLKPVCVDYVSGDGLALERFHFVFFGGVLNESEIGKIEVQSEELDGFKFVTAAEALGLLAPSMSRRLPHCLEAIKKEKIIYLENGEKI